MVDHFKVLCWIKRVLAVIAIYLFLVTFLFIMKHDVNIFTFSFILLILIGIIHFFPCKSSCSWCGMSDSKTMQTRDKKK